MSLLQKNYGERESFSQDSERIERQKEKKSRKMSKAVWELDVSLPRPPETGQELTNMCRKTFLVLPCSSEEV